MYLVTEPHEDFCHKHDVIDSWETYEEADEAAEVGQSIMEGKGRTKPIKFPNQNGYQYCFRYLVLDGTEVISCHTHRRQALRFKDKGGRVIRTDEPFNPMDVGYDNPPDAHKVIWQGTLEVDWQAVEGIGQALAGRLEEFCQAEDIHRPADLFVADVTSIKGMSQTLADRLFDHMGMIVQWTDFDGVDAHMLHIQCEDIDTIDELLETDIPPEDTLGELKLEAIL